VVVWEEEEEKKAGRGEGSIQPIPEEMVHEEKYDWMW
jgi:hypothetical protein